MKAVRSSDCEVAVVDVDEPPVSGELLHIRSASICGSDLDYIRWGSPVILGHKLAVVREDGKAVAVEAIYGCLACDYCHRGAYNLCPRHPWVPKIPSGTAGADSVLVGGRLR